MAKPSHTSESDDALATKLAEIARRHLGATESPCPTAAAIAASDGRVFTAKTIISKTPGLSVCALRLALARATAEAAGELNMIVGAHPRGAGRPCGLCRQSLSELAAGTKIYIVGANGGPERLDAAALLPEPFLDYRPDHEDTGT